VRLLDPLEVADPSDGDGEGGGLAEPELARLELGGQGELADGAAEPRRRGVSGATSTACPGACRRSPCGVATAGPKKKERS
jgi:hypothetical protein